ncbi:spidroin-2 [Musca vetustissima]|uniref:spidroin-2 n=1 Tax=Musca vetustissima TaxID=27455 RepID=UPI002AB7AD33|nr:spidroin-2 [Musca vetustissima]
MDNPGGSKNKPCVAATTNNQTRQRTNKPPTHPTATFKHLKIPNGQRYGLQHSNTKPHTTGLGILLLLSPLCLAQSGYQYGRNDLNAGGVPATVASPLRPLTGGFGAASTAAAAFPTAATAFGPGTTIPSGPFGGFGTTGQNQRGIGGLTPTAQTAFGSAATNIPKRPNLAQRPTAPGASGPGSIYGQAQFGGSATGRGGGSGGGGAGSGTGSSGLGDDYDGDYSAIPGVPGVDYPIYSQVPQTNFDCAQQALPGYYSDIEAQCQVFHICALNRTYSFLCPNGTIFSQEVLVCVWWNQYDCASAPSLYANNAFIYDYGNERIPTNAGYQPSGNQQQLGRGQTGILAANAGRPTATGSSNIFNPQRLQPSVTGGGGGGVAVQPSAIAGVQGAGGFGGGSSNTGRFGSGGQNPGGQTFPATPSPFGSVLRSGSTTGGGGGGGGGVANPTAVGGPTGGGGNFNANVGETAFGNAAIATPTTKNREYLPPPARRQ